VSSVTAPGSRPDSRARCHADCSTAPPINPRSCRSRLGPQLLLRPADTRDHLREPSEQVLTVLSLRLGIGGHTTFLGNQPSGLEHGSCPSAAIFASELPRRGPHRSHHSLAPRGLGITICECRCGAPGWECSRLGAGSAA
jgi:hypothetical protein